MTLCGNVLLRNKLTIVKKIMHFSKALSVITFVGKISSEVEKENMEHTRR